MVSIQRHARNVTFAEVLKELGQLQALTIAFMVFMTVTFVLRMFTRRKIVKVFRREDWTMIIAYSTALATTTITLVNVLMTRRALNGDLDVLALTGKLSMALTILGIASIVFTRISFGFFFLNIFTVNKRFERIFIWTTMLSVAIASSIYIPILLWRDIGLSSLDLTAAVYAYKPAFVLSKLISAFSIISDFGLTLMSFIALRHIQLTKVAKLSAAFLLGLGSFAGAASTVRLAIIIRIGKTKSDTTMDTIHLAEWALIEVGICVGVSNMALIRPFFTWVWEKFNLGSNAATTANASAGIVTVKHGDDYGKMQGMRMLVDDEALLVKVVT